MPPPNKVLLPSNLDQELGDLRRRILGLETAGSQPTPQVFSESVDAAHPMYLDFVIPSGVQPSIAKLSFKLRLYRTTSSSGGGNTGAGSSHAHGSAAHSHTSTGHLHTITVGIIGGGQAVTLNGNNFEVPGGPVGLPSTDSTTPGDTGSTTPGNTGGESSHTHSVGGSSLGVSEGTATTISALAIDGVDKTSTLGGPWLVDTVDLDVSKVLPLGDGLWHVIQLTPASQGRIVAVLKIAI